jgi:prephenate dehydrogenase
MQKIGIVGYGQFGEFISSHLAKLFEVRIFSSRDVLDVARPPGAPQNPIKFINYGKEGFEQYVQDLDYLIISVPFNAFLKVCEIFSKSVSEKTIILDVTSVKVKPIKLMQRYFLNNQILGTHPIFGPQSGKNGIENLPLVLCNVSLSEEKYEEIKNFLSEKYKLNIIEKTAVEHDKEMAYVQGLTHFIGRTITAMNLHDFETGTKSYRQLLNLVELIGNDSWDLYKTIQNANPYTDLVREEFLKDLNSLEEKLKNER